MTMIRIITDTASDLSIQDAKDLDVTLLPMTIEFGKESFKDRYEIEPQEFYERLTTSDDFPITSQVNPFEFKEVLKKYAQAGDDVIIITLGSHFSGTFQRAHLAATNYDNVYVVDSSTVTVAQQCLVRYAATLRDKGLSAKEIVNKLNKNVDNVRVLAIVDTLEYLKKGGRISSAAAVAGGLLSIKPILTTINGLATIVGKARGKKNANTLFKKLITEAGGIDYNKPIAFAYSGTSSEGLDAYLEENKDMYQDKTDSLYISQMGSSVGTHGGPGVIAIGFFTPTA